MAGLATLVLLTLVPAPASGVPEPISAMALGPKICNPPGADSMIQPPPGSVCAQANAVVSGIYSWASCATGTQPAGKRCEGGNGYGTHKVYITPGRGELTLAGSNMGIGSPGSDWCNIFGTGTGWRTCFTNAFAYVITDTGSADTFTAKADTQSDGILGLLPLATTAPASATY